MAQNNDATDAQIANYSRETYDEYLEETREANGEPVYEDGEKVVFADESGRALNIWAEQIGVDRSAVLEWANSYTDDTDYNWGYSDPLVLLKH